jgi:hypothetical protein
MTSWQATSEDGPTGPDGALRAMGLAAVGIGVAALAAATFVLSYQGIRAVALQAGIEPRYAKGYPLVIDAMLVIALAAVLALRGAGLPSRMLAWLTLLIVLCAAAGADTLHATGRTLPHNAAVVTAAVLPWALVLVAFVLLLAMLRYARLRRQASVAVTQASWTPSADDGQAGSQQSQTAIAQPLPVRSPQPWQSVSIVPGFTSQLVSSAVAGAAAGAAVADVEPLVEPVTAPEGADSQPADTDQEATAAEAAEPVAAAATADVSEETQVPDEDTSPAETESYPPALADELTVQSDETEPHADEAQALTDEAEPPADPAEPPADETQALTDETEPQADEAQALTDETEPQADEAQALTDEAEPPADPAEPPTDEAPPQSGEDDGIPVFRRIRSSPTPPDD